MEKDALIHDLCSHASLNIQDTISYMTKSSLTLLEKGFLFEDIPKYCHDLKLLKHLVVYGSDKSNSTKKDDFIRLISEEVTNKVCLGLLVHVSPTDDNRKEFLVLLGSLCQLTAACVSVHSDILSTMIEHVLRSIRKYLADNTSGSDEQSHGVVLDIYAALEIARHVLPKPDKKASDSIDPKIDSNLSDLFKTLSSAIVYFTHDFVGTHCLPVILKLLDLDNANLSNNLHRLWVCIQDLSKEGSDSEEIKDYILLCGLANWFFPVSGSDPGDVGIMKDESLWVMLQKGLLSKNPLTRKRSLYLVKRIVDICEMTGIDVTTGPSHPVFWWDHTRKAELSKVWQDFMLLAEVLEEKQVHVIKPLLPRMKSLITASTITSSQDLPFLHTSWLTAILLRCAHHESIQIIRWSAEIMLSLDLHSCPMLEQGQQKYLTGQLLNTLRDTKLFNREPGSPSGRVPALGKKLVDFFHACWKTLPPDKRGAYFCETVQNVCRSHWGTTPLIYVCRALSMVPSSPCLDRETILDLRHLLTGDLVTAEPYLRGAITGFVTQLLINLVDTSQVRLEDVMQVLVLVRQDDCLQRGTTLWDQCVDWLKSLSAEGDNSSWSGEAIREHLETSFNKYLEVTVDSKFSSADMVTAHPIARLLLIASDATIATKKAPDEPDVLTKVNEKLALILNSINTHSYMSRHKADKAIQMFVLLVKELGVKDFKQYDTVAKVILTALESCQSEMLMYICGQIKESIVTELDRFVLGLYMEAVDMLAGVRDMVKAINFERITCTSIAILNRNLEMAQEADLSGKMRQLAGMCILGKVAHFLSHDLTCDIQHPGNQILKQHITEFLKTFKIITHFKKPTLEQNVNQKEWGKITSLYLQHQWQVVLLGLQVGAATLCSVPELIALATGTISVGLEETSIIVMNCLAKIIQQPSLCLGVSDSDYLSIMNTCWTSLQESRRSQILWSVLGAFVHVVFQPSLMSMEEGSTVLEKLREVSTALIEFGSEKMGVVNMFTDQLTSVLSTQGMAEHAIKFAPIIVELCKFGGQPSRGQRQLYDVGATVEAFGSDCAVNGLRKSIANGDLLVRATIVDFLCGLDPSDSAHCCLATELIRLCSRDYTKVLRGSSNSYANSLVHRRRHRLIQTVLLLKSFVTQDFVSELWQFVWTSLEQECQPSIRHVLEWIAMATMTRYPKYEQELWTKFEKYRDSKNVVLCSLLCITIHLGPQLPPDQQSDFYNHALPCILPWCMAHHFTTRIFAQATLCKLWTQCQDLQLHDILNTNQVLQGLVNFNQENRNSTTNVKKLLDSFFFKALDFDKDFTLEILYHILPTMTDLTEEDWIRPEMFVQVNPAWAQGQRSSFIALRSSTEHLNLSDFTKWRYTALKIFEEGEGGETGGEGDVQKKIMPWKQMVQDLETTEEIDHGVKAHEEGGLVVVTSLISKIPNLGGLCRTSEIFGVSEYVLGKLKHTEDKAFQGLSVTAHKWVPITEVSEPRLPEYLQQKREEGYTLVGVEQTANSVCLTDFTFPVKSLLLLGNEKEGIPVDLISLLDVCVEIPQQGVVRSLNVHVSGALLIWEYRRQQLVKGQGTG